MTEQTIKLEEISRQLQSIIKAMKSVPDASSKMANDVQKSTDKIKTSFKGAKKEVDSFDESFDEASNKSGKFKQKATQVKDSLLDMVKGVSSSTIAMLGLGGGMLSLVSSSFQIIQNMGTLADSLRELSTDTGNTSKAVGTLYAAWGNSLGNMQQLESAMHSLNNAGIPLGKQFTELTSLMGDLDQMTGISADSWGHFTGSLAFNFKATTQDIRDITSAVISSGLKGQQMQVVMESISKAVEHVGYSAKDSKEMVKALAQSISASVGVFQKLGISAQSATQFLDKMIDPNEFQNNAQLFARLGISADDFFKSMESGQGSMDLMNKMMTNLPDLANKLSSIQNPFQRFNIAKQMGLPMEMVSKLAGKTRDEIQEMMQTQMQKAKSDEALKKKKEEAKASQARFNEMLEMLKMQALAPIVALVSKHLPTFIKILTSLANLANSFFTMLSPLLDKLATGLGEIASYLVEGANKFLAAIRTGNLDGFIQYLLSGFKKGIDWFVKSGIPLIISFLKQAVKGVFEFAAKNPLTTGTALVGGLLAKKFFGKKGESKSNPMFVEVVKGGIEGLKDTLTNLKKLPELFKGEGGIGGFAARAVKMIGGVGAPGVAAAETGAAAAIPGGGALAGIGTSLSTLAPVALPVIAALAAVAGGFVAMSNAADYFGKKQLSDEENKELEWLELKKKFDSNFSEEDKKHYDELLKRQQEGQATFQEKLSSFLAGAGTFGIAPLVDKIFGTEITGSIANWIKTEFQPELEMVQKAFTFLGKLWNRLVIDFKRWYFQYIEPAFKGIIQYAKGFIQVIVGLFTFNPSRIKKGIQDAFSGAFVFLKNSFLGIFGDVLDQLQAGFDKFLTEGPLGEIIKKTLSDETLGNIEKRRVDRVQAAAAQNVFSQAQGIDDANTAYGVASNAQGLINNISDAGRRNALQKILDNFRDAAISKNKQDAERYEEEKKSREQSNKSLGGIGANLTEMNERDKNRTQQKSITAQMLNPFAVSQIRFF